MTSSIAAPSSGCCGWHCPCFPTGTRRRWTASAVHRPLHELAIAAGISDGSESHAAGAERFLAAVRAMNYRMDIPRTLPEIRQEDIPDLARYAHREANPLYPVPVLWDAGQLEMFYYKVMEGGERLDRAGDPAGRGTAAVVVSKRAHPAC